MELFANQRDANLESTVAMVEDVLIELGHFLNDCRVSGGSGAARAWRIRHGSATIDITLVERNPGLWLRAKASLFELDDRFDRPALYAHLLALNGGPVAGAAFALDEPYVALLSERSTIDLDRSEVLDLVSRVTRYADHYDDELVELFTGG